MTYAVRAARGWERSQQVGLSTEHLVVNLDQHVSHHQTSLGGGAYGRDLEDHESDVRWVPARPHDRANGDAEPRASIRATKKPFDNVAGDREGQAARDHGGDSDDAAAGVNQGPAGIARFHADVRLHPARAPRPAASADRMNDARGQRPRSPERVAAGKCQVAWPQARGVAV